MRVHVCVCGHFISSAYVRAVTIEINSNFQYQEIAKSDYKTDCIFVGRVDNEQ